MEAQAANNTPYIDSAEQRYSIMNRGGFVSLPYSKNLKGRQSGTANIRLLIR